MPRNQNTPPASNRNRHIAGLGRGKNQVHQETEAEKMQRLVHEQRVKIHARERGTRLALADMEQERAEQAEAQRQRIWEASLPHGVKVDERMVAARSSHVAKEVAEQRKHMSNEQLEAETARKRQATIELGQRIAKEMEGRVEPDTTIVVTHNEAYQARGRTKTGTKVLDTVKGWKIDYKKPGAAMPGSSYVLLPSGEIISVRGPEQTNGPKDHTNIISDEEHYGILSTRIDSDLNLKPLARDPQARSRRLADHEASIQAGLLAKYATMPEGPQRRPANYVEPPAPATSQPNIPIHIDHVPYNGPLDPGVYPITPEPLAPGTVQPLPADSPYVPGQYTQLPPRVPIVEYSPYEGPLNPGEYQPAPAEPVAPQPYEMPISVVPVEYSGPLDPGVYPMAPELPAPGTIQPLPADSPLVPGQYTQLPPHQ